MPRVKRHTVHLTPEERARLRAFTRTGTRNAQSITRARILLLVDEQGEARNDVSIAQALAVNVHTVETARKRYCLKGINAVLERKPRLDKGRPVKIDGRVQAHLITLACSDPPAGTASWTLQLLSDELVRLELVSSISRESVRQVLKKTSSDRT